MGLTRTIKRGVAQVVSAIQTPGRVRLILAKEGPVKLHVGAGRNYKDGWVNIDFNPKTKKDLLCDLSRGIPFPDNSVDYIYNEHFIEHLSYEDGFAFMKEACRVLKPGGVMRIACPDLDDMIRRYMDDSWRTQEWVKLIKAEWYPSGCYALNQNFREDGEHRYIYNEGDLARRLKEAGFASVQRQQMNQSSHAELRNIERRADSLIVDAQK